MTIVSGLLGKAQNLLTKAVTRKTKVYDASKNKFIVAGITLDGLVSVEISGDVVSRSELGIDQQYYTYYEAFENTTANISVLPTADCNDILKALKISQQKNKGWVKITIYDNGVLVGNFRGHLVTGASLNQSLEPGDKDYSFGLMSVQTEVIANILTAETPVAIEVEG